MLTSEFQGVTTELAEMTSNPIEVNHNGKIYRISFAVYGSSMDLAVGLILFCQTRSLQAVCKLHDLVVWNGPNGCQSCHRCLIKGIRLPYRTIYINSEEHGINC